MRESRFQINVATGRMTLPVAILFCLMIWGMSLDSWKDLGTLGITVLTGYLMIETNTAFSLIRTRTSLPVSIYWCLFSALVFLHPYGFGKTNVTFTTVSGETKSPAAGVCSTAKPLPLSSISSPRRRSNAAASAIDNPLTSGTHTSVCACAGCC